MSVPTMFTSFVGRERETSEVARLLTTSRLVTLTGTAGCGKTRIAQHIAETEAHRFGGELAWVELARLTAAHLVTQEVMRALDIAENPAVSLQENLSDALQDRGLVLVLDNCEHLVSACAGLVKVLLTATKVRILATSREPLGVSGERLYPVPPLTVPPAGDSATDIAGFEATQLFVERARAILPAFELTTDNAGVVARICRSLDGMPLAIELASARINVLALEQIAERLDLRLVSLPPAPHMTADHHGTLRAALDWSHDLLSTPEQIMLRRLAVFTGGVALETVEVVCAGDGIELDRVLDLLTLLVSKSLVTAETLRPSESRYSLLETVRQYAEERLIFAGESPTLRDRHLTFYSQLIEDATEEHTGNDQNRWLDWFEAGYADVRSALAWSLESKRVEDGLRIAIALFQLWTVRDYADEGLSWFEALLGRADETVSATVRANALAHAAFLAGFRGNTAAQMQFGREATKLTDSIGSEGNRALVWALAARAHGARAANDFHTEFRLANQVIDLFRELGEDYYLGLALSAYSFTAMSVGEYGVARAMLDEGLVLLREAGTPYRIAMALNFSGDLARCESEYVLAKAAYQESISILRDLDATRDLASALHNLGHACLHLGEVNRAYRLFKESLELHQEQRNTAGMTECLIGFAAVAVVRGLVAEGVRLLGAVEAVGGKRVMAAWQATLMDYEYYLARARAGLSEVEFRAQHTAGRMFPLEHAIQYALKLALTPRTDSRATGYLDQLTKRERDVAAKIAMGRSNEEIAGELLLSKRTVEKHISNIRSKLGATERTQIARWAFEAKLVDPDHDGRSHPENRRS